MASKIRRWSPLGNSAVEDILHLGVRHAKSSPRNNRYKCVYYDRATGLCEMINIGCVGPSNRLCHDYCTHYIKGKRRLYRKNNPKEQLGQTNAPTKTKSAIMPKSVAQTEHKPQTKTPVAPNPNYIHPSINVKVIRNVSDISVGMAVGSKSFGDGTIVSISEDRKYCKVEFECGIKTFAMQDAFDRGFLKKK